MPKRTDIHTILVIGAGPIIIGQACEFDYAGTQACKALKQEGYRIILINSNPATIMTDPGIADVTYIEPITPDFVEAIIAKEKPDALLPTLGGQTALNCALALAKKGILEKYQVELIGASVTAIELAENRSAFQTLMHNIGLEVPKAIRINSLAEAKLALEKIALPIVIRSSFSLGGSGAGIVHTKEDFLQLCQEAFATHPEQELMLDEALIGWKEFELEAIRDKANNCIIVCGVENVDPLGIHTGDSITVAPIQTLTDKEYQQMRQATFDILRAVGVDTGGSNVQFAVHPKTGKMVVIEMNPRVSRSSALVSKASGFPIAKIAAKLAVGYSLDELKNDITGDQLPASFEPSLDYVVVKIPRFNFDKFTSIDIRGPQMRSVGEVMSIGRTFSESLQKAMRSLEINLDGFVNIYTNADLSTLETHLQTPGHLQLLAIGEAFRRDMSIETVHGMTHIDPWFLQAIQSLILKEKEVASLSLATLSSQALREYKKLGFSDTRIAELMKVSRLDIAKRREQLNIHPAYKRVDSCAGEFTTSTAYLYGSYDSHYCESSPTNASKILVIGSGPNRIGQGIEFDYCCVQAVNALKKLGYETIMLNCNPETVSTDYDVVDRLYFIPLTLEDVLAVIQKENPLGVFIQYGGQTPLQLAKGLAEAGVPLLGLDHHIIQLTENRHDFQQLIHHLQLQQPKNASVYTIEEAVTAAKTMGYPLILRPSFVLGGRLMQIVNDQTQLTAALAPIIQHHPQDPILIEQFLQEGIEVDVDAISDGNEIFIPALLEQVESAGIHSGDSACFTPPLHLSKNIQEKIKYQTQQIARYLKLKGVFNIQFLVKNDIIYIIEVNPRASRTLPFLCKITGFPLIEIATKCILGHSLASQGITKTPTLPFTYVKEAVLPFIKFPQASPLLGPEMKSTGEVMGIGQSLDEAYAKAQIAAGNHLPREGNVYLIASPRYFSLMSTLAQALKQLGFSLYINQQSISSTHHVTYDHAVNNSTEVPHCVLILAIHDITETDSGITQSVRFAIEHHICHTTSPKAASAIVDAIRYQKNHPLHIYSLQENLMHVKTLNACKTPKKLKHLLTGEELTPADITYIIAKALSLKQKRKQERSSNKLIGKQLALLFSKPSLRTRFSFTIAMNELGGNAVESVEATRKYETPEDLAGVLGGYCDAIMLRTHEDENLVRMSQVSKVPIINGLSALHHPCQILADLLTLHEMFGALSNLTLTYIGDGNNILHSLLLLAPQMGVNIHYCCPKSHEPHADILASSLQKITAHTGQIRSFDSPQKAVTNADAVYTDVWSSMGFEEASNQDEIFDGFQVNEDLMKLASSRAIFMHCLPMERGKEVSETLPDQACSVIYQQSENRLHIQKAILLFLLTCEDT